MEEADLEGTRGMFRYDVCTGELVCEGGNARSFRAGWFTRPSLAELRAAVDVDAAARLAPGPLRAQQVLSDVSLLHADPGNRYATFQAASQFNCLEFVHQSVTPEDGISGYSRDRTQGPACAVACAPGTIVRNYFGMDDQSPQQGIKQVENLREVEDLLCNTKEGYLRVIGGYTIATDSGLQRLGARLQDPELAEKLTAALRVGVQWDTQVTNTKFGAVQLEESEQIVTQVYGSACSVSYSGNGQKLWEPFASLVLRASYEATFLAAIKNLLAHPEEPGARRVFLTALGGGVFGNDMKWVAEAMAEAMDKCSHVGLEVVMVSFGLKDPHLNRLQR